MNGTQIGVDLAKAVCEIAVSQTPGRVQERRRLSRAAIRGFFAERAPAQVVMEAGSSAHHWGREFQRLGHSVLLLHPSDAARYRDGNKTDSTPPRPCSGRSSQAAPPAPHDLDPDLLVLGAADLVQDDLGPHRRLDGICFRCAVKHK